MPLKNVVQHKPVHFSHGFEVDSRPFLHNFQFHSHNLRTTRARNMTFEMEKDYDDAFRLYVNNIYM